MCNFRRKKILEVIKDAQEGKISFEERDSILEPYEKYIDRVLDDCKEMDSEFNINSKLEDRIGGLDMKRICEEIQENDSESNSNSVHQTAKASKKSKKLSQIDLDDLKKRIRNRNYSKILDSNYDNISKRSRNLAYGPNM